MADKSSSFQEIGITAAIQTVTGLTPDMGYTGGEVLVRFTFPNTPEVQKAAMAWASGALVVNGVQFEKNRAALYRRVRTLRGRG